MAEHKSTEKVQVCNSTKTERGKIALDDVQTKLAIAIERNTTAKNEKGRECTVCPFGTSEGFKIENPTEKN